MKFKLEKKISRDISLSRTRKVKPRQSVDSRPSVSREVKEDKENDRALRNRKSMESDRRRENDWRLRLAESRIHDLEVQLARSQEEKKLMQVELEYAKGFQLRQESVIRELQRMRPEQEERRTEARRQTKADKEDGQEGGQVSQDHVLTQMYSRLEARLKEFKAKTEIEQTNLKKQLREGTKALERLLPFASGRSTYQDLIELRKTERLALPCAKQLQQSIKQLSKSVYQSHASKFNEECLLQ